jgi:hypothetical protein
MPTERDDRADEVARVAARREVEIFLTHDRTVFTPDMAIKLLEKVDTINTNLAVVCADVNNLKHTLLGNTQPGKCKEHETAIGVLKTFMDSIKGQVRLLVWLSGSALAVATLVLTFSFGFWGVLHKGQDAIQGSIGAAHVEATTASHQAADTQAALGITNELAEAAALQRDATDSQVKQLQKENVVTYRTYVVTKPKK